MKQLKFLSISVLLCTLILFAGCNNDDEPNGSLNFTAEIDGKAWAGAGNSSVTTISTITTVAIGAGNSDNSAFAFVLDSETTGIHDLEGIAMYTNSDLETFSATSGTMTITKFETNKVSGTFSFSATAFGSDETIEVTNGKFTDVNVIR